MQCLYHPVQAKSIEVYAPIIFKCAHPYTLESSGQWPMTRHPIDESGAHQKVFVQVTGDIQRQNEKTTGWYKKHT